ncbi:MAG: ethanolamine ammonia-lyase subunit EutC [Solirubrobacteraceae bacterium]|nr:ethanolamine ammonia-lyase subunit EutC [Solirubrobacteraceae bacterium]
MNEETPAVAAAPSDVWAGLRGLTPARIGIGRSGDALPTGQQLALRLAHARARDAVHAPLDLAGVQRALSDHPVVHVRSAAPDRPTYLQRPDLGRTLAAGEADKLAVTEPDLAFVVADGLSPLAAQSHAPQMIEATIARLPDWSVGPVVVATQARVALGDEIGAALGARFVVVLIGERPGLSAADSLGIYLTFGPHVGRRDSERNCISNVRPPVGLSYAVAADKLVALLLEARRLGLTGVELKDEAPTLEAG